MLIWTEVLLRLLLASFFGALIGLERERKHWAAGLRTHMMVCVGASLVMIVSAFGFRDILGTANVTLDPSRVAAHVVSGIGFIGAGAILFSRQETIRGLPTASSIWVVAAIGLAVGGGLYFAASATTVIALIILWVLNSLEIDFFRKSGQKELKIITDLSISSIDLFKDLLNSGGLKYQTLTMEKDGEHFVFLLKGLNLRATDIDDLLNALKNNPSIKSVILE